MGKILLVAQDFTTGAEILHLLDRSDLVIKVAMWLYTEEFGDWRFVLASRRLDDAAPGEAYGLVHRALKEADFPFERTPPLSIFKMNDRFIRELRRLWRKVDIFEGMRLSGQPIGDRFVEDALVYRVQ